MKYCVIQRNTDWNWRQSIKDTPLTRLHTLKRLTQEENKSFDIDSLVVEKHISNTPKNTSMSFMLEGRSNSKLIMNETSLKWNSIFLTSLIGKLKRKCETWSFVSRLRNTTKGCDDSLRSHCFLLTLAPFLMKVKHRRSRLLPKLFVTILNPSVQPKIQMTLSPVFFFQSSFSSILFYTKETWKWKEKRKSLRQA